MAVVIGDLKFGNFWHSSSEVSKLLVTHTSRYPQMGVQDVYKLLYQGAMGSEHFLDSFDAFEKDLSAEWESIQPDDSIPMWENIRPDGQIVRFYLPPFKARDGQVNQLLTLSYWTTTIYEGNLENLKSSWETFEKICQKMERFSAVEVQEFGSCFDEINFHPSIILRYIVKITSRLIGSC
jgi:hypothetical protein